MPRKKQIPPLDPALPVQLNVRVSRALETDLDRWTAEINYLQKTKMTRPELLRGVLTWAAKTRPDWQGK